MVVFFNTNILLDIITQRSPHFTNSQATLDICDQMNAEVVIAWHGLATAFYIVARQEGRQKATELLKDTLLAMRVVETGQNEALRAFDLNFTDLEDAMQASAAEAAQADFLITRDPSGFSKSPVPALSPHEFVARFAAQP